MYVCMIIGYIDNIPSSVHFRSASMSRKLLRQRSIKEAKAQLEHKSNSLSSPTIKKHFPLDTDDSFDRMMKAHADFTNQLLKVRLISSF